MIRNCRGAPHLVRVVIQNPVLGGRQGGLTGGEGGSPERPLVAADVSAQPCAPLAPLVPGLSPAEGHRPRAFSALQEEDAAAAEHRQFPEHIQGQERFSAAHAAGYLPVLTFLLCWDGERGVGRSRTGY